MNSPSPLNKSDCYAAGERGWMEWGQRVRAIILLPLLKLLTGLRVTADSVTLVAALVGLAFVPLWAWGYTAPALLALLLHVLLDGLDGPLARFQHVASNRGSFTDTFADQIVVTAVTITWMLHVASAASVIVGCCYIFLYAVMVAFAMVRNAMAIPYSWLVRPRFFVYASIALDAWFASTWTVWLLGGCDLVLAWKCCTGFLAVRRGLPGPTEAEQ